jgi:hypothetical protein
MYIITERGSPGTADFVCRQHAGPGLFETYPFYPKQGNFSSEYVFKSSLFVAES